MPARVVGRQDFPAETKLNTHARSRFFHRFYLAESLMHHYSTLADDWYCNMNLSTEMQLPAGRETILGFFERLQKTYPSMRNFYTRENGDFVLEEDKEHGQQRWLSIEPRRICSGYLNPTNIQDALEQHNLVLELIPYMLSVSQLDCEALDYILGFEYLYRGNHDEVVAEALGVSPAYDSFSQIPGAGVLNYEPSVTLSLEDSCRRQARMMIETRTSAYQVRRNEFPEEVISVYFTLRQYGSLGPETSFEDTLKGLREHSDELVEQCVIEQVLHPLAQAISAR